MKKVKYIFVCLLLVACAACDLLDVSPRQEMRQDEMFKKENGFKSALIGVYIKMASADLYGMNMTFYMPDMLVKMFLPGNSNFPADYALEKWDFENTDLEKAVAKSWEAYYNCIAQLNDILANIDAEKGIFSPGNYELIKGEALGLRGFLHAEILRFWGPMPSSATDATSAIPYAEVFSKDPSHFLVQSWKTVCDNIVRDLNAAEELLANDPILEYTNLALNRLADQSDRPADGFQLKRQSRFNYYAVMGAKARFYHWIGKPTEALYYSRLVIESEKFRLATVTDVSGSGWNDGYQCNLTMTSEHLFAVNNTDHQNVLRPVFKDAGSRLLGNLAYVNNAYEGSTDDIRNATGRYWREIDHSGGLGKRTHFLKYSDKDDMPSLNRIPVMRLSEMVFIFVENNPDVAESKEVFTLFKNSRNISASYVDELDSPDTRLERLRKEHLKDFYGEGQLFFFYKKHSIINYTWPFQFTVPAKHQDYKIPMPRSQTNFEPEA